LLIYKFFIKIINQAILTMPISCSAIKMIQDPCYPRQITELLLLFIRYPQPHYYLYQDLALPLM